MPVDSLTQQKNKQAKEHGCVKQIVLGQNATHCRWVLCKKKKREKVTAKESAWLLVRRLRMDVCYEATNNEDNHRYTKRGRNEEVVVIFEGQCTGEKRTW